MSWTRANRCMNRKTFPGVRLNGMSSSSESATIKPHIMEMLTILSMHIEGACEKSQSAEEPCARKRASTVLKPSGEGDLVVLG